MPEKNMNIICFGNSLTAGYGFTNEHSYPGILQQILDDKGYNYNVVNAGVSGETSAGGLNRISQILNIPADIFILELGINDGLRGFSLKSMKENLQKIIERVKERHQNVKLVIAGMHVPMGLNNNYVNSFMSAYPELAATNNAILIPFFLRDVLGVSSLNLPDRLHPNKEGYKIIAQNVFEVLKPHLNEPAI